jgi:hypothetical protein
MVRRSVTLTPEQDAWVDEDRRRRGWTRSLWFQELLKAQMAASRFVAPGNMTDSRMLDYHEREVSR